MSDSAVPDRAPVRVFDRRRFLRDTALVGGGAVAAGTAFPSTALAAGVPRERLAAWLTLLAEGTPEALADYQPVALTPAELTTLKAAIDRLIPADDLGPGATEAGVFVYIDRILADGSAAVLPLYQGGLAALDAVDSNAFVALGPDRQDDLLTQAEAGDLADVPAGFFPLLLEHTRQGMFCDPIHGGNRNFAGWDLLGYPGIKLVWSEADQAEGTEVEPEHVSVEQYREGAA